MKEIFMYYFKRGWAILIAFWLFSVLTQPEPTVTDRTPHWTNADPSRHPSEIDYYDYANRRIVYMDPPKPFVPKIPPKPAKTQKGKKSKAKETPVINLDELDELDYELLRDFYMD